MNDPIITLYIADDHQIIIDGLQLLLSNDLGFKIIGTANEGDKARKEILSKKPDIALIDLRMPPGLDGIQLINSLKKHVSTKFIILSMHNERRYINDAINYGASGYLLKNTGKKELLTCIEKVMRGESHFPPKPFAGKTGEKTELFTPREIEILKMVINELTTQEISEQLNLSHYTVETHRKNICRKTNTKTAVGLLKYVEENGIEI